MSTSAERYLLGEPLNRLQNPVRPVYISGARLLSLYYEGSI